MPIDICFKHEETKESYPRIEHVVWHIGDKYPWPYPENNEVMYIVVSGEELILIKELYINVPLMPDERIVRWYGDHAKFIVGNLPEYNALGVRRKKT